MTEKEWLKERIENYKSKGYMVCPICESEHIVGGNLDVDGSAAWLEVSCEECGAEWADIYKLSTVEIDSYPTGYYPGDKSDPNKMFKNE